MKGFILTFSLFSPLLLTAQTFSNKNTVPPAVATSEFTKQINNGVSYQTGQSQTSITLFNLDVDDGLNIPIVINYDGGGIKYLQPTSEVGLGWNLSPNFRVTRTVYCRPDEHYPRATTTLMDSYMNESNKLIRDKNLTQFTYGLPSHGGMKLPATYQLMDSEYDIFDYSVPTTSGSFVIENPTTKLIATPDNARVKFDYVSSATQGITKFTITDTKGNKIVAGQNEATNQSFLDMGWSYDGKEAANSWPVTKITTPNNNVATFNYVVRNVSEWSPQQSALTIREVADPNVNDQQTDVTDAFSGGGHNDSYFVQEIRVRDGYVTFFRKSSSYTIDSVCMYNSAGLRLKKAALYYGNGMLDSVTLMGRNDWDRKTFKFAYNSLGGVPDIWGNYTSGGGTIYSKAYNQEIGGDYYYKMAPFPNVFLEYVKVAESMPIISMNRTNVSGYPEAGSLNKVTLPTGGYITFVYQPNFYGDPSNKIIGPGIRLLRRTEFDPVTNKSIVTEYKYGVNGNGVGNIPIPLTPENFAEEQVYLRLDSRAPYPHYYYGRFLTYSNDPITDNDPFFTRYNVVTYPEVTETVDNGSNGSTVYYFNYRNQAVWNSGFNINYGHESLVTNSYMSRRYHGGFVYRYNLWNRPELYKKEIKNATGSVVQREEYNYSTYAERELKGMKVRMYASFYDGFYDESVLVYNGIESVYDYGEYFISIGNQLLQSKVITNIENGVSIVDRIDYTYNTNQQLIKEETTGSDGLVRKTHYAYANQFGGLTDVGSVTQDVLKMSQANIVDDWVESRKTVTKVISGTSQELTTSANFKTLIPNSDKVRSGYRLQSSQPVSTFNPATVVNGKLTISPAYIKQGEVTSLDANGNVKERVTKEGIPQLIIRGYGTSALPIAVVEGATSGNAAYTSFEVDSPIDGWLEAFVEKSPDAFTGKFSANLNLSGFVLVKTGLVPATTYILTYWTKKGSPFTIAGTQSGYPRQLATVNGWTCYEHKLTGVSKVDFFPSGFGLIDEVRLHPLGAQMTSYTHDPLVGITTKTDLNNRVTYYEYDNLNRFKLVKDQNGHIVQIGDYQYNVQP